MQIVFIILPVLIILMFILGLDLKKDNFTRLVKQPKAVLVGLFGQVIALPLTAIVVNQIFDLPPPFALGLLLIALCAGGATSNTFTMFAGGDVALGVTLTGISSFISIITIPLVIGWFAKFYLQNSYEIVVPFGKTFLQLFVAVFLPIVTGMICRHKWPEKMLRLKRTLNPVAMFLLIGVVTLIIIDSLDIIKTYFLTLGGAVLALFVIATSIGSLASRVFSLNVKERRAIIMEIGMQNAAQAITIAASPMLLNNSAVAVPAVIYVFWMNILLLAYMFLSRRKDKLLEPLAAGN